MVEIRKAADSFFVSDTGCSLVGEAVGVGGITDATVSLLLTKAGVKFFCGVNVGP